MKRILKPALLLLAMIIMTGAGYYAGTRSDRAPAATQGGEAPRKILYYRHPMGQSDTSPVPKRDEMGMDYIPVYEGEVEASGTVALSPEKIQLLGVRSEPASLRSLQQQVRATALLEVDERKQQWIAPRFEGWVSELQVNQTGQQVRAGAPLLAVYSPELESAAREYQLARESGLPEVEQSARQRLANWGIAPQDLAQDGKGALRLQLRAPISGTVIEKKAINGARFAAGEVLFRLADLSVVWLQAEVAEQDQGGLRVGQAVKASVDAYPGETFSGRVSFVSPVLNEMTRTVRVRVELNNRDGRLRPGMYASVQIHTGKAAQQLCVPQSAVIDSGARQVVLVQVAPGRFQPRSVRLGARDDGWVAVLEGLAEGETVVTQANFLIDAESNLRAALSGMQAASAVASQGGEHAHATH
ncbi:MAG TPA: efflux RND transporter periplasmic adaptor subunit [Gallionellaceae bacterium]|nr:efflux RND transporter periplasmic adaptor subunit [Gallionellaceae bacterium]